MSTLVLPAQPKLSSLVGQGLGRAATGLGEGLFQGLQQKREKEEKNKRWEKLFPNRAQVQRPNDLASHEPRQMQSPQQEIPDEAIAMIAEDNPQLANILQRQKSATQKMSAIKEAQLMKFNEPKLAEINDRIENLENQDLRFEKLEDINTNFGNKLPDPRIAALFSKHGQIDERLLSVLSPEAQEFVKLIVDSTSDIKDSYGARITNFDLSTYLKKLPSLMNTPEGREKIIRDLRIINKINRLRDQSVLDEFVKSGGSGRLQFSEAQKKARESIKDQIKQLKDEFINPNKTRFNELPDAIGYKGREFVDEETGQEFVSDGKNWIPK